MKEILKSSLFGYSKKSVCEYIAGMNEEFSQKLLEKDLECKNMVQELKSQIEELKKENEQLQTGRQEVAGALIDAKNFAAELKERAEAEDQARRIKNEEYQRAEFQRIQRLSGSVDALHGTLQAMLGKMDAELEAYKENCQTLQREFHEQN